MTKPWPWMGSNPSHEAVLLAGSCAPPCRSADIPAVTLPRAVSVVLWWRILVKIAAALAEPWDVEGKPLACWLPRAASFFGLQGSMDFISNPCAWHRIGNQCRKGYEGTDKFQNRPNLGLGKAVFHGSSNWRKQYQSHWKDEWRRGLSAHNAIMCVHG